MKICTYVFLDAQVWIFPVLTGFSQVFSTIFKALFRAEKNQKTRFKPVGCVFCENPGFLPTLVFMIVCYGIHKNFL